ncbi:hypothetical protein J6590_089673 [Homalodisca vitripennis]|nr:hypothetical protein J6590_089673 [Homalodisca vitripennis]
MSISKKLSSCVWTTLAARSDQRRLRVVMLGTWHYIASVAIGVTSTSGAFCIRDLCVKVIHVL